MLMAYDKMIEMKYRVSKTKMTKIDNSQNKET